MKKSWIWILILLFFTVFTGCGNQPGDGKSDNISEKSDQDTKETEEKDENTGVVPDENEKEDSEVVTEVEENDEDQVVSGKTDCTLLKPGKVTGFKVGSRVRDFMLALVVNC